MDGQLGKLTLTNEKNYTLLNFSDYTKILAISSASSLLAEVLMEREELPYLYDDFIEFLENLKFPAEIYLKYYALFELSLLKHLGFGLDLTKCAVSGVDKDLSFISPKTGNAVSFEVGAPYENKLFKLPQFFTQEGKSAEISEILDGIGYYSVFSWQKFPLLKTRRIFHKNAIMFSDELLARYRYDQEKRDIHRDISPMGQFSEILSERYLAYALSTITSRSLPDVRDGLKPVHRRIIWAMHQLKLDPKNGYKKCARVVGDVIGKYHPHGDTSVYDAMVRLAQNFSLRYPMVDGQGNFGSIDGDNAAAMRYTESRLTSVATFMLQDINQNTVDFRPTYDSLDEEPIVLPGYFPNLLANGSEGIAVGMATSIPPHNVEEICDALLHLQKKPTCEVRELVEFMVAPDFPTGGEIVEPLENIVSAYETGRGSVRLRSKWHKEDLGRGIYQIVVTEIPYQVQKSKLLEKIADLLDQKKIPLIDNIRDESDDQIRVIIEPKNRTVSAELIMESLFKVSDLEVKFSLNLNAIDSKGLPRLMNLKDMLGEFLSHRTEVLVRKSKERLDQISKRLELLEGFLVAYLNIDEVIRIIREEDEPADVMMKKFKLTKIQVEAILNMRLRSLRKLEEFEIRTENKKLLEEKGVLEELLADEKIQKKEIANGIKEIKKVFGKATTLGARRTVVTHKSIESNVISIEAFIEKEPVTIIVSKLGWVRSFKGHNIELETVKYKEDDEFLRSIKMQTTDKILFFTSKGKCYTVGADKISGGRGFGDHIRLLAEMEDDETMIEVIMMEASAEYLIASNTGRGFIIDCADLEAQTKNGKAILNLKENEKAIKLLRITGTHIACLGDNRKMIIFPVAELPKMKRGLGVTLQKFNGGKLTDLKCLTPENGMSWVRGNKNFELKDVSLWLAKRAGKGRIAPVGLPKNNTFEG